ncbi:hypothetical protein HYU17_01970 [Candidatus Woesearchaeota archaeon]|nr:hypothetical protein [Candidatus Woesearchaeota archaeon]
MSGDKGGKVNAGQFQSLKSLFGPGATARYLALLLRHKALLFATIGGMAVLFLFGNYIKNAVVLLLLALIAVLSTIYKRYMRVPPAVELVTFSTVLAGVAYGPLVGALFGAVVTVAAEVLNSGIDAFIIGYIPARAVVGFTAAFFPGVNIVTLGLLMSLLYNAVAQPLYAFQSDAELRFKLFAFVLINVPFNFVVFSIAGEFAKGIIT